MKINSVSSNNPNFSRDKKQALVFKGRNSSDIMQSVFFLMRSLEKERYVPRVKNPAIKAKLEPKQKGKVVGK